MKKSSREGRAAIPSMTALLDAAEERPSLRDLPRAVLLRTLRECVDALRQQLIESGERGDAENGAVTRLLDEAERRSKSRTLSRLRPVINATGIVLHTGLGRAVLADVVQKRLLEIAAGYCNLEIDLATGERGRRGAYAERLLCDLTGAEAAMIVNNNAAATMLALRAFASGREVIVSRGQLIEIGGSFRLPEVMTAGGARLREVGTTNKTRLGDYKNAITPETAMIMHVHTSNYRVVGFAETPAVHELVELAHSRGLTLLDDLGSGALSDDSLWSAAAEPTVADSLRQGADLLCFSGDKLLGGPQAGILLGRRDLIDAVRRDPMARAVRVDKLTLAAMEATLELYGSANGAKAAIPALSMLSQPIEHLSSRADELAKPLRARLPAETFDVMREESFAGGGSLPAWPLPTAIVVWTPASGARTEDIARRLRLGAPSVLARVNAERILFDVRTIRPDEFGPVAEACAAVRSEPRPSGSGHHP